MRRSSFWELVFVIIAMLGAFVFMMMQLPESIKCYRPNLLILSFFYICLFVPKWINIWVAWVIGLILDSLDGFILGNHAMQFIILASVVLIMQSRLRMYSVVQHIFVIAIIHLLMVGFELLLHTVTGQPLALFCLWMPVVTTALSWPLYYHVLRSLHQMLARE